MPSRIPADASANDSNESPAGKPGEKPSVAGKGEATEARYRAVARHASVGVYRSTPEGELIDANQPLVRMLGYASLAQLREESHNIGDLYVNPGRRDALLKRLETEGELRNVELRLRRRDGSEAWFLETARIVHDEPNHPLCYEGLLIDITEQKQTARKLRHRATHDPLTGLPNRELTRKRLKEMLARARLEKMRLGAVLRVDLDVLKRVSDTLGYPHGDHLLRAAARRLHEAVERAGSVSRHEGDEFVVLVPDIVSPAGAETLAKRIEDAFAAPFDLAGHSIHVRTLIGIVLCDPASDNIEAVLRDADAAMMACKRHGERGTSGHMFFDSSIRTLAVERLQLETGLRAALDRGEFEVHYQPICRMKGREIAGFEALVRWRHPEKGVLGPEIFLPVAKETGLILKLGQQTLSAALRDCARWQKSSPGVFVTFNLSDRQFHAPGLIQSITDELERCELPARLLHVEVTEDVFMVDPAVARVIMQQLHELGIKIYLDDFGTGYSGLSYLNELPFDALKIDRGFIGGLVLDKRTRAIVRHIVTLAHELDMDVVAEGVESADEAAVLAGLDCRLGQGYLFDAAMPARAVRERLEAAN